MYSKFMSSTMSAAMERHAERLLLQMQPQAQPQPLQRECDRDTDENDNKTTKKGTGNEILEVLPKIFVHLPFDSLLTARQVCSTWNTAICSHPLIARRCVVTVRHSVDAALGIFLGERDRDKKPPPTLSSFRFITKYMNNASPTQIEFWEQFGPCIQHLDLDVHALGAVSFLEVMLACPNLKELSFDCVPICVNHAATVYGPDGQVHHYGGARQYQKLIPNSPFIQQSGLLHALEVLTVSNSNYMPPGVLSDLLLWGGGVCPRDRDRDGGKSQRSPPRLRSLSIMDDYPGVPFTIRGVGAQTQVRSLYVSSGSVAHPSKPHVPSWDPRHVLYVIQKQAQTLTILELSGFHILPEHIYALSKIKALRLRVLKLRAVQADTPSLIALFRRQKSLEELDLSYANGVSDKAFLHPSCTFFRLQKLSLAGYTSHLDFLGFLSRMGPSLVELNLSSSRSNSMTWDNLVHSFLPIKLRRLSRLDLSYCVALGSLKRPALFQSFMRSLRSTLTCLNLSCNTCIKNNFLQVIWHELWGLRILYLETLPGVTDEGFTGIRQSQFYGNDDDAAAGSKNQIIDYLNNSGVLRRHNNGAGHIGYCAHIETLSLANNQKLTDFVAQYGVRFLANLRKLKLAGCPKLTDRCIFYLIGSCAKLEYLDLRGCPRITQEWINWAESAAASPNLKILLDTKPPKPVPTSNIGRGVGNVDANVDVEPKSNLRTRTTARTRQAPTAVSFDLQSQVEPRRARTRSQDLQQIKDESKESIGEIPSGGKEAENWTPYGHVEYEQAFIDDADADIDTTTTDTDMIYSDDEATSTDSNSVRIIMPRKHRHRSTRVRNLQKEPETSSGDPQRKSVVILTPPSASSSRSPSRIGGLQGPTSGGRDAPFKINIVDANNNQLKIPK